MAVAQCNQLLCLARWKEQPVLKLIFKSLPSIISLKFPSLDQNYHRLLQDTQIRANPDKQNTTMNPNDIQGGQMHLFYRFAAKKMWIFVELSIILIGYNCTLGMQQ